MEDKLIEIVLLDNVPLLQQYLDTKIPSSPVFSNYKLKYQEILLLLSAKNNSEKICEFLLSSLFSSDSYKETPNPFQESYWTTITDPEGNTPLHLACRGGHLGIIYKLFNYIPKYFYIDSKNKKGNTALHEACNSGSMDVIRFLLCKRAFVNNRGINGSTPLILASSFKNCELVELLLKENADINLSDDFGRTPLLHCLINREDNVTWNILSCLLEAGCNVNQSDIYSQRPLSYACRHSSLDIANKLIEYGAELEGLPATDALWKAVFSGRPKVVDILLKNKCKSFVDHPLYGKPFFLHFASSNNLWRILEVLLTHNTFDKNEKDDCGMTSLNVACQMSNIDSVIILLDSHVNVNDGDFQGFNPFLNACINGRIDIIKELINSGCDIHATTAYNKNGLFLACQNNQPQTVKFLLQIGLNFYYSQSTSTMKCFLDIMRSQLQTSNNKLIDTTIPFYLLEAGYDMSKDESLKPMSYYLETFEPGIISSNNDLFDSLNKLSSQPLTLQSLCRNVIRKQLGNNKQGNINLIYLPKNLKGYLTLENL